MPSRNGTWASKSCPRGSTEWLATSKSSAASSTLLVLNPEFETLLSQKSMAEISPRVSTAACGHFWASWLQISENFHIFLAHRLPALPVCTGSLWKVGSLASAAEGLTAGITSHCTERNKAKTIEINIKSRYLMDSMATYAWQIEET